jgi:2,3-bisphosphoglycerate-independent phosphoglycerate mutase
VNKKTILIITDGIGHNPSCDFNAFCGAKTPTYDMLFSKYPNSLIKSYGKYVGLPDSQMGNSEVGHMSIGSGRVLYQDLVKINLSIKENRLKHNSVYQEVLNKSNTIHLIGLLSDGGVHSHIKHIKALALLAKDNGKKVYIHAITDGRDVSPTSATKYIKELEEICDDNISIATISGRFYSMDRDNRWDRVEKGYIQIVSAATKTDKTPQEYIDKSYEDEIYDEFLLPVSFDGYNGLKSGDGVVFCNFRSDRARQMVTALADKEFKEFNTKKLDLNIATMTNYDKSFNYPVMFDKDTPKDTLSEVISRKGLTQLHTAETEKYAHVTFFFNGGIDEPYENEQRVLIPSPKVATYDLQPAMSADKVGKAVLDGMNQAKDFIVVNFANGDMVGHTGVYDAGVKAVEAVDTQIGLIYQKAQKLGYNILLTSDHGNCEMMRDKNGNILTNHTVGDVYAFVIADGVDKISDGGLDNIAPTVLKLMGLDIPQVMSKALY